MQKNNIDDIVQIKELLEELVAQGEDSLLQSFVSSANKHGVNMEITLTVSGFLISGTLISIERYYECIGDIIFSNCRDDGKVSDEELEKSKENFLKTPNECNKDKSPLYIHLEDVSIFYLDAGAKLICNSKHSLWRGRISEVQGFYLGTPADYTQKYDQV